MTPTICIAINGVKQGDRLTPVLINIYNNDLNLTFSKSNIGCRLGGTFINHIAYANELYIY